MTSKAPMPLRIGFDTPFPPFAALEDGTPCGVLIEVAAAVAAEANVTPEWVPLELDESEVALMEGTVDALAFKAIVPARRAVFDFSSPILRSGAALFISPEATLASSGDIARFGGRPIATPRRGALAALIAARYPGVRLLLTASYEEALNAVADRRADAAALNLHAGSYWIRERFSGAVLMPRRPFLEVDMAIATSKKRTDGLIKRLEAGVAALRTRGWIEALLRERQLA